MTGPNAALQRGLGTAYTIERELGGGGMSRVYLATECALGRPVVVKLLDPELAAGVSAERFAMEIRVAATLQHPNIVPLLSAGSVDGLPYYTMPFVAGESLRARLAGGPLPIAQVLHVLYEVGLALAYAHQRGVVHRDIKPENVLLTGGVGVVTDFGIAKAIEGSRRSALGSRQESADGREPRAESLTIAGTAIGTPAYMAPEQVAGDADIDERADIYAFGCLAYEMLAGRPPFHGMPVAKILAAHLATPPEPVTAHRPDTPAPLAALVMRCLAKDPADRWPRMDELVARIEALGAGAGPRLVRPLALAGAAAAMLLAAAALLWTRGSAGAPAYRVGRVSALTTAPGLELDPALSPDGGTLAYAAGPPGATRIYLRPVAGGRTIPLTDDGVAPNQRWPQWSPDGRRIAFQAGSSERQVGQRVEAAGTIYLVPALGGTPTPVVSAVPVAEAFGPAWSPDGRRLAFVRQDTLFLVDAEGGAAPWALVSTDGIFAPRWSPDGRTIVYSVGNSRFIFGTTHLGNAAPAAIRTVRVADGRTRLIEPGQSLNVSPVWTPDGRALLFVSDRGGRRDVYRVALDRSGGPAGEPERLTTGIDAHTIQLSADGSRLVYSAYTPAAHLWALPLPRGAATSAYGGTQLTFDRQAIEGIALSRDGRWLAFDSDRSGNFDVWKIPTAGGQPVQLTTDPAGDFVQSWSPAGDELVLHSFRTGNRDVFVMNADGTGAEQVTATPESEANPFWGADGNSLVIHASPAPGREELWVWTRARRGARWTRGTLVSAEGVDPSWSPDGRWISWIWTGAVHLASPAGAAHRVLVPADSTRPTPAFTAWMPDSRTLLYMAYDAQRQGSIWSVPLDGGAPRPLVRFDDPARPSLRRDFATDGRRLYFAIAQPESDIFLMELERR